MIVLIFGFDQSIVIMLEDELIGFVFEHVFVVRLNFILIKRSVYEGVLKI